jgi:hypothetical protein
MATKLQAGQFRLCTTLVSFVSRLLWHKLIEQVRFERLVQEGIRNNDSQCPRLVSSGLLHHQTTLVLADQ